VNVIITGVGGFIGTKLAQEFLCGGNLVLGVYKNTIPKLTHHNLVLIRNTKLEQLQANSKFDYIIDCAAQIPSKTTEQSELYINNVNNAKKILDFASKHQIKKIIYMSSMSAYGDITCAIVTALTKDQTRDLYGRSKADSENLIRIWCQEDHGRTAFAIRLPGIIGKDSHSNFISNLYKKIKNEKRFKVYNRDSKFNNILYINTLIEFIVELASNQAIGYHNLLVASKSPITIEDIVNKMLKNVDKRPIIEWDVFGRPFLIDYSESEKFGFKAIDTEESISKFLLDVDERI
jgi:nucleoside-diphosphate-sugar epimerase